MNCLRITSWAAVAAALLIFLAGSVPASADSALIRETEPLTPEQEQKALKVPAGFEIQLFASEPMINKPINLAYDKRGRLWVSSTMEYPYPAKKERWADARGTRVRDSRDAIKILEDTDGDGVADKVIDFADGLNVPTGVLPWHKPEHKDGCVAWSIPNIWYFADTTGDGRCDHREVLFGPLGWEKDTHGMLSSFRLGPDGWIYATHGFNNTSHFKARDGSTLDLNSGNVFRFQPDGSRVEIWSRGQVNPFGLCFDRRGNLYSADCHSSPIYQLLRGAFYPSFGKPHDGIGFGPAMIQHTHGSTGICGIVYFDRGVWGTKWNDHILIGNPVTSRVNRDRIEFVGSTPVAVEQPDFVTSDDPWFRPVDLCLGGDGALYVADFYNRIIGHYEVPLDHPGRDRKRGRIWRIVKKDGVSSRKPIELPTLSPNPVADLRSKSPFIRRAAASYFQASPILEALPSLLNLLENTPSADTHLRHVVRMAVREQLKLPGAFNADPATSIPIDLAVAVPSPEAAAFLLRHLNSTSLLQPETHRRFLTHIARHGSPKSLTDAIALERARVTLLAVPRGLLLDAFARGLAERGELRPNPELLGWAQALAPQILGEQDGKSWIIAAHPSAPKSASPWGFRTRQCSDGATAPTLTSLPRGGSRTERLTGILRSKVFPAPKKLSFWVCGHRGPPDGPAHDKLLVRLVGSKSGEELRKAFPPRSNVCQRVDWDLSELAGQPLRLEIVDGDAGKAYAWIGVTRIEPRVVSVDAFPGSAARSKALRQLAILLQVTAPADLRDQLRPYLPPSSAPAPIAVSKEERERLDKLIRTRTTVFAKAKPNSKNGQVVFETHCAVCHQVGGKGALLGPQLDGIGSRGVARLCEDILDPNRNVDAHFYLTTFKLKDGTTSAGFVRGESGAVTVLVDPAGAEHRLQKSAIAGKTTMPLSLMPPSFDKVLSEAEFNDLLGWLLQQ